MSDGSYRIAMAIDAYVKKPLDAVVAKYGPVLERIANSSERIARSLELLSNTVLVYCSNEEARELLVKLWDKEAEEKNDG